MTASRNKISRVEAKAVVTRIRVNRLVNCKGKTRIITRERRIVK